MDRVTWFIAWRGGWRGAQGLQGCGKRRSLQFRAADEHYALVQFHPFSDDYQLAGRVAVSVDCAIEDWRPDRSTLDPSLKKAGRSSSCPIGQATLSPNMAFLLGTA